MNRHTDQDKMAVVSNFIKVNANDLQLALIVIPSSILLKLPNTFQPQMMIGEEKSKDLIYSLRQSVTDHNEFSEVIKQLMAAQGADGKNMLTRALKSEEKVPRKTLIKIPSRILMHLPSSFRPEMEMGVDKAQELIQCLRASFTDKNASNSVIFKLMTSQSKEGTKLLMHAMYYNKTKDALKCVAATNESGSSRTVMHASNINVQRSSLLQTGAVPNVSENTGDSNLSKISNQKLSSDFNRLNDELILLSRHMALVKNPIESYMYSALRKSIFCDMCAVLKAKYENVVLSPHIPEIEKMRLHKVWQDLFNQYNSIQMPIGFNLVPAAQRKSLETCIADYRRALEVASVKASKSHSMITSAHQHVSSSQPQPIKLDHSEILNVSRKSPIQDRSDSASLIAAQNDKAEMAKANGTENFDSTASTSNVIIVIDDDDTKEKASPSISNTSIAQRGNVGISRRSSSVKKKPSIVIDDDSNLSDVDTGSRTVNGDTPIHRAQVPSSKKVSRTNSSKRSKLRDGNTSKRASLLLNKPTMYSRIDDSEEADDGSFISEIRSLNKDSSPSGNKKRKASFNMEKEVAQNPLADFKWQEGFVQGLFYNFGMESPFGDYNADNLDQVYFEGFKAASSYYTKKVGEND